MPEPEGEVRQYLLIPGPSAAGVVTGITSFDGFDIRTDDGLVSGLYIVGGVVSAITLSEWEITDTGELTYSGLTDYSAGNILFTWQSPIDGHLEVPAEEAVDITVPAEETPDMTLALETPVDHGQLSGLTDNDHTQYVLKATLTTNGDMYTRIAGSVARLAVGSANQVLGVSAGLPAWQSQTYIDHGALSGLADDDHTQYALNTHSYVTLSAESRFSAERVLTGSSSVLVTDGGAGTTVTLSVIAGGVDHGGLAGLADDDHTQYLLLAGRGGEQDIVGGITVSTYERIGSNGSPANTTAGDLTVVRLFVGDSVAANNAIVQSVIASFVPAAATSYYHSVDVTVAPGGTNTNERDAVNIAYHVQPSAADGGLHHAVRVYATHDSGAFNLNRSTNSLYGLLFSVEQNVGSSTVTDMAGVAGSMRVTAGTATTVSAFLANLTSAGGTLITTYYAFRANAITSFATAITTSIGLSVADMGANAAVGTAIGVDIAAQTLGATANFGIRNAGNSVQTGYARFGAVTAPNNTTAGDVTATRLVLSSNTAFSNGAQLFIDRASTVPSSGRSNDLWIQSRLAPNGSGGSVHDSLAVDFLIRPSAADAGSFSGLNFTVSHDSGSFNLTGTMFGAQGIVATSVASTTVTAMTGFRSGLTVSTGTLTTGNGFHSRVTFSGATAVTTMNHFDISIASHPSAGTTHVGLNIPNLGNAAWTNAIGIDIAAQSGAGTLNFGIRNAGNSVQTGYASFGAVTVPTNTTAGDVTCVRLKVGDAAFASGAEAHITGDAVVTGWFQLGSATAPGATGAGDFTQAGKHVATPTASTQITAVGATISHAARIVTITADNSYTLTSTPTISDGENGEILTIINVDDTDVITLQDQGSLAGSNLRLSAASIALGPRDSITLVYSSVVGDWVQVAQTNVV